MVVVLFGTKMRDDAGGFDFGVTSRHPRGSELGHSGRQRGAYYAFTNPGHLERDLAPTSERRRARYARPLDSFPQSAISHHRPDRFFEAS